jgi:alkanesulfonate monooxygenase SsuD/methylene tetrahydromethanopterin reductase-like flavin-dependent oxidoreductase (luciferase family)
MKLGVYLNAQHPRGDDPARRFAETLEQARMIRALGFDSIWGGEHHATPGFHYFPLLPMLQRLAAEAEGLAFGTNLVLLPLHNPAEIAEIAAFLDVTTGGRFTLGVGLGYRSEEFAIFGVRMAERVSRLIEGVELIRRLWTEDEVTHHGRHWTLDKVTIRPRPLQTPCPLVLVGSQVPAGIERAARIADGWLVVPVPTVDEFARQVRTFAAARAAAGRPAAAEIGRLLEVSCASDEEQLRRLARNRFAVGSPAEVTEALLAQAKAGATHATMRVSWPGMPQKDVLAGIELLGTTVLPEVRRRLAAG